MQEYSLALAVQLRIFHGHYISVQISATTIAQLIHHAVKQECENNIYSNLNLPGMAIRSVPAVLKEPIVRTPWTLSWT